MVVVHGFTHHKYVLHILVQIPGKHLSSSSLTSVRFCNLEITLAFISASPWVAKALITCKTLLWKSVLATPWPWQLLGPGQASIRDLTLGSASVWPFVVLQRNPFRST